MSDTENLIEQAAGLMKKGMPSAKAVARLRIQHPELKAENAAEIMSAAIEQCDPPALYKTWQNSYIKSSLKWWGGSVIACLWALVLAPVLLGPDAEQGIWFLVAGLGITAGTIDLYRAYFPPVIASKPQKGSLPGPVAETRISTNKSIDYKLRTGSCFLAVIFGLIPLLARGTAALLLNDARADQDFSVIVWLVIFGLIGMAIMWIVWPRVKRFELTDQVFSVPRSALKDKTRHQADKRIHVHVGRLSGLHHQCKMDDNGEGRNELTVTFRDNGQDNSIEVCFKEGQRNSVDFLALNDALELHIAQNQG